MREQATEIENLIKKCEKAGIPTDYEKPAVHILNQFAIYLEEDMTTNDRSRVYYTLETTTAIYNEAKTNLQGYLDGTKSAKEVKKFISSDVTINGQSTYATVGDESGLEERPVYFVGYGHSDYLTPYIEQFKDYGMNTIQNEAGTAYCIKINDLVDWQAVRRANGDIVKSTNVVKIGSGAAKLSFTDEPKEENFVSLLQYVNVEPGKTYEFKGSVKGDGVFGAYADISEYGFNKSTSLDGTYDWKDFSVIYTVPEGLTRLAAQVVVENATSGLYLDNLSVCEVGKSENLLKNGDFEETEGLGLKFDKDAVQDKINILKNQYELSEKNDISFDLNLSIQKSWTADIQEYSKEYGIATQDGLLIKVAHCSHKFTPTHPKTNELVELYLRNYVDMIKDVECIDSFCISNEPQLDASAHGEYFLADWQNYLKERYNNDIAYLNKCYKTEYSDFEEIGFYNPQDKRPAMYYDQKKFNDKVLGNWHRWMAAIVKEYIPDAVMHSKIMGYTFDRTHLYNGTGYEEYTDFYDANGSDYWDYIDDNIGPVAKQMWYDYMTSLKDAPVYNSEDHVIRDSNQTFIPEQATHVGQDIYQNAVHGRARTQIWLWQRDTASHVWGSLLYRPDVIWEISKSALDINRNAYELTALQNQDREVGIIYSDASILNDEFSMPALYEAYASALYNGQRVMFVTETQPEKMMGRKLVIVPKQRYVNEATINYLKAYIENGGRVVILDEESLKLNEYNLENEEEKVKFIFDNSLVIPYEGGSAKMTSPDPVEFNKTIRNILKEENAFYVSVVDADTKEPVYDMEYNLGVYEGDILVNINNYGEHKNISVMFGDKPVTEAYELRSEEMLGEVIGIDKYQSITLKIKNNHTFLDAIGHWGENNIAELAEKNIVSGVSDSKYNPDAVLTRAQFLALMIRASGGNNSYYKNNVPDVENDAWYATSVAAGVEKGIIPAGVNFRPDEPITREDMCVMLVGFYEAAKGTIEASKEAEFSDSEKITAKEAVNKAVAKELIFGHSDGKFAPQGSATSAEAAAVVSRFIAK